MNFLPDAADEIRQDEVESPAFAENVVVMPTPHEDSWHGLWACNDGHEEIYGDRDEVIAWARDRSSTIQIWNEALQDLEPLSVSS